VATAVSGEAERAGIARAALPAEIDARAAAGVRAPTGS
jgi:hypothetical protein